MFHTGDFSQALAVLVRLQQPSFLNLFFSFTFITDPQCVATAAGHKVELNRLLVNVNQVS